MNEVHTQADGSNTIWRRLKSGPALPALVAAMTTATCELIGWRGTDVAEQVYRVTEFRTHGLAILDPGWYDGMYLPSYSLVYPVVASVSGIWVAAGTAAALAAACFDSLIRSVLGRRPLGSWYLAAATTVEVAIGQLTFLTGEALGLATVLALARRRYSLGVLLAVLAALASPVAGAFLSLAVVAWGLADQPRRRGLLPVGLIPLTVVGGVAVLFPGKGWFPFTGINALAVVALCALIASPWLSTPPVLRTAAVLYAAVTIGLFAIPTMMGDNDLRLAADIGIPLMLCYGLERLHRPLVRSVRTAGTLTMGSAFAAALIVWAWTPAVNAFDVTSSTLASTESSFYRPLLVQLRKLAPTPVRIEVPPTLDHWESAYIAPVFPLARGWERQLDRGDNPIFYAPGPLSSTGYRSWLVAQGVSYVALANAPLDFAAVGEAALLRSGRTPGLKVVWKTTAWTLWRVVGSPGLVSGPATVTGIDPDHVDLVVRRPGPALIRVRWSNYWSVPAGAGCLSEATGGWTELQAARAGPVRISASLLHSGVSCEDRVSDGDEG